MMCRVLLWIGSRGTQTSVKSSKATKKSLIEKQLEEQEEVPNGINSMIYTIGEDK